MTEINQQLLQMIQENNTINEISKQLCLTHKQIYRRITILETLGYGFNRKYYYSGDIIYQLNKKLAEDRKNEVDIITAPSDSEVKLLVISDLHFGSELQRLDLLDMLYNYCKKEGINIIINSGDLIDGLASFNPKKIEDVEEQVEYVIKKHPFDKNILNFLCLGNHDYELLKSTGRDLETILYNKRHDIIPVGYKQVKINIKNDCILVQHPVDGILFNEKINQYSLVINGHQHKTLVDSRNNAFTSILVPSLSDIKFNEMLPGAIKLNLHFQYGKFIYGYMEQLMLNDKVYKINEIYFDLGTNNSRNDNDKIALEEEISTEYKIKSKQLSQIEKFNQRYNYSK